MSTLANIPEHEEYREKEAESLNKVESWLWDPSSGVSEATLKDAFSDVATDVSNVDTESVSSNNSFRWELEVLFMSDHHKCALLARSVVSMGVHIKVKIILT